MRFYWNELHRAGQHVFMRRSDSDMAKWFHDCPDDPENFTPMDYVPEDSGFVCRQCGDIFKPPSRRNDG